MSSLITRWWFCCLVSLLCGNYVLAQVKPKPQSVAEVNYAAFCSDSIGSLLTDAALQYYESATFSTDPPGVLNSVLFSYGDSWVVEILPTEVTQQKAFNSKLNWSLEFFKKEIFRGAVVWRGHQRVMEFFCEE